LLEQRGFKGKVEIKVEENRLVLSPGAGVREGWDDAFRKMATKRDDRLLETPPSAFDEEE
jgi:antitoxin MazE